MNPEILVVGLNHSTAPVEVRERITFGGDVNGDMTKRLRAIEGVDETIILATCNRTEVIAASSQGELTAERIITAMGELHCLDPQSFRGHLYVRRGAEGVRHVFRVASSLDSMVLGEPQILGQVKDGYRRATTVSATGPFLNRLMHRAFFTAKRVRTETGIGTAAVSVAYVAVELAKKILGELTDMAVLLIGAGEMAELAARHLLSQVEKPIVVVNRTIENACTLARKLDGSPMPMDKLEDALAAADVVITSTGSCEPVITAQNMKRVMRRRRFQPLFLIDIAIPRDVEPQVNDLDGVYLYNIDDLQAVVQENLGERRQEALRGEHIVDEEVDKFLNWSQTLDSTPVIVAFRDKLENIRKAELTRLNGKLSNLSTADRETVEMITRSIINKIAHDPILFLKRAGKSSRRNQLLDVAQRLFNLDGVTGEDGCGEEDAPEQ